MRGRTKRKGEVGWILRITELGIIAASGQDIKTTASRDKEFYKPITLKACNWQGSARFDKLLQQGSSN